MVYSEENGNLARFLPHGSDIQVSIRDNILSLISGSATSYIGTETLFNASAYDVMEVTLRLNKRTAVAVETNPDQPVEPGRLTPSSEKLILTFGWRTTRDQEFPRYQRIQQSIKASSQAWITCRFILAENPLWQGDINGISLFVTPAVSHLEISKISLQRQENRSEVEPSRFRIGSQTRSAFLLRPSDEWACQVVMVEQSALEFGLAPVFLSQKDEPVDLKCTLTIQSGIFFRKKLFEKQFFISSDGTSLNRWYDVSLDLTRFAGKKVKLVWRCEHDPEGQSSESQGSFLVLSLPYLFTSQSGTKQTNLLLMSIDTLRADHLGCYGYPCSTSPSLDLLSRHGSVFSRGITPCPSTAPAHISLFTGLYPFQHGVLKGHNRLNFFTRTLAEQLMKKGLLTYAVTGGGNVSAYHRIDKGFLGYNDGERSILSLQSDLIPWLRTHHQKPFFAFYHTYEVHAPYRKHEPLTDYFFPNYTGAVTGNELLNKLTTLKLSQRDNKYLVALYDSGIRYTDTSIGRLFHELKKLKIWDNTLLILLSDHGEHFAEHGLYGHGNSLYSPLVEVPIIMSLSTEIRQRHIFNNTFNLIDVIPTTCALLGFESDFTTPGHNYAPVLQQQKKEDKTAFSFSELKRRNSDRSDWIYEYSLLEEDYKLILSYPQGSTKLFAIPSREREVDQLAECYPEITKRLQSKLQMLLSDPGASRNSFFPSAGEIPLDQETKSNLKALGYYD
ncbi:sulfatase [candidate division CSSED10-310 bacterium]|uniref:Sulfatase n=1 Tax=candidate division CSSED10-310 bacterium TaxID=2855610 RepID=A0ABV6YRY7_UNCC1